MKELIKQLEQHARAAKTEPDKVSHLDAIIGTCRLLAEALNSNSAKEVIEFTRDYHRAKANEIDLNAVLPEKLTAIYYARDRLQYTADVLQEVLNMIEYKKPL